MQKINFFVVTLLFSCFIVQAQNINQEVIASQGSYDISDIMILEWTLGEPFVETLNDKSMIYTQGFHQPTFNNRKNISVETAFSSVVFPNPTKNSFEILLSNFSEDSFYIQMYDLHGRLFKNQISEVKTSRIKVNVTNLPSGIYLLKIIGNRGTYQKTHKIIKH